MEPKKGSKGRGSDLFRENLNRNRKGKRGRGRKSSHCRLPQDESSCFRVIRERAIRHGEREHMREKEGKGRTKKGTPKDIGKSKRKEGSGEKKVDTWAAVG